MDEVRSNVGCIGNYADRREKGPHGMSDSHPYQERHRTSIVAAVRKKARKAVTPRRGSRACHGGTPERDLATRRMPRAAVLGNDASDGWRGSIRLTPCIMAK